MSQVAATLHTDFDKLESGPPGGILFAESTHGEVCSMIHKCPCGCGEIHTLRIGLVKPAERPSWRWNGSRSKPTLLPSVDGRNSCGWHGYLNDGVWESC